MTHREETTLGGVNLEEIAIGKDALGEARPIEDGASIAAPPQTLTGLFHAEERSLSFTGNALTALSKARTRGIVNPITKDSLTIGDVIIASTAAKKLGIGEAKLLRYGVSAFTRENAQNTKKPSLRIHGDTRDFARANKIKIDPQPMATPEEQEKENRRAAKALENFIAKLAKNADTLKSNASFSWREVVRGKTQAYNGVSLISAYKIDSDVIMLEFSQTAAEYMIQLPLADTPRALYAIDDRQTTAYAIAEALIQHYGIENNVMRNTERMLKVETLLSYTSLPSIDECKEKRLGWEHFVKEPFEKALETLYEKGLIAPEVFDKKTNRRVSGGWRYSLSGMEELTEEQATTILRYEQFASLYVCYELSGYEPHADRVRLIAKKREEKKKASAQKCSKKLKKASPDA